MKAMDFSAENLELPENKMFCLIDGNKGIYIPRIFAQRWGQFCVKGLNENDLKILLAGPDHMEYFEVWDDVVYQIQFLFEGQLCELSEDGDLFAVPV